MKNTFAVHVVAASASVALGTTIIYPLDSLAVLKQVGSTTRKQLAVGQILARVRNISGYSGLYSGLGWLIAGRTFGLGARFGVYEILTAFYKDGRGYSYVDVSEALMAGFAAGIVESLVTSPFEIVKLRAQVASASRSLYSSLIAEKSSVSPLISSLLPRYSMNTMSMNTSINILSTLTTKHENLASALRQYPWMMTGSGRPPAVSNVRKPSDIIALEGWHGLWRGLRSGVVRDSIFGGVFFSSWQFLHNAMINWKAVGMDPTPRVDEDVGPLSPLAVSLAAGVSGSIAGATSHCFDTAKSRTQCTVIPKYISMERKLLKWRKPGKRFERLTGIHPADRNLLLNGIQLRTVRCGLSSFLIVGIYFLAIDLLASD